MTTTATEYTLEQAREFLTLPPEALLGVEYRDPRVSGSRNDYDFHEGDPEVDPVSLQGPWAELRAAVRRGNPSREMIVVHLRSVSRGIDGIVYV